MSRLIVGNWKQNPATLPEAHALAEGLVAFTQRDGVEVVVCPPFTYLADIAAVVPSSIALGAQDVSIQSLGAHTGTVGADMLHNLGVRYVILGHSERRAEGETDAQIAEKVRVVIEHGMTPMVCIGEPRVVRDQGMDAVYAFLATQLSTIPDGMNLVIAYEPIWAIGSGTADDPASAAAVIRFIHETVAPRMSGVRVLYGGSVTPDNAAAFLTESVIDGFLVGGASLDAARFLQIVDAASQ